MSRKIALATFATLLIAAPAAQADWAGKTTNKYGTVRLYFDTNREPQIVRITLPASLARNNRLKPYQVQCRRSAGEYETVIALAPFQNGQRRLEGPAERPRGATRCRVQKSGKTVASMRIRPT